jgi:uncharacterized protein (DUF1330 family)
MPKGYIYAEIEVINPLEYAKWRATSLQQIEVFGGRFLVQRGNPRVIEGGKRLQLAMIIEFESRERALEWYEAMKKWRTERGRAANLYAVLLTGYDDVEDIS